MIELGLRGMKCWSEQEFTGQLSSLFVAQTISERRVTQLDVALLVNFGEISLQVRRLERRDEGGANK